MKTSVIAIVVVAVAVLGVAAFLVLPRPDATIPTEAATIPTVTIGGAEYSFTTPESFPGGLVRLNFVNNGQEDHHAQMLRLNDGVTFEQFLSTFEEVMQAVPVEGDAAFLRIEEIAVFAGGPPPTSPGQANEVVQDLRFGNYVLLCFLEDAEGIPHVANGMIAQFAVIAAPVEPAIPPRAQGTVELGDFAFVNVPEFAAGKTTLQVTNSGSQPHEMIVLRLRGISADQLLEILSAPPPPPGEAPPPPPPGPPPFEFVGGIQAFMPGETTWITLDLSPGEYVVVCFIPSPLHEGAPHLALGMNHAFTIR